MRLRAFPWVTAGVTAACLLAWALPGSDAALQYDRTAVEEGAPWRLATGQLVHWTPRMLAADLSVLALLGGWLEPRSRRLVILTLAAGGALAGLGVHLLAPELSLYRGSSGLASALFVAGAAHLAIGARRGGARYAAILLLVLFAAKVALEWRLGRALAAGPFPPGVAVVPLVHVMGGLGGLMAAITVAAASKR